MPGRMVGCAASAAALGMPGVLLVTGDDFGHEDF